MFIGIQSKPFIEVWYEDRRSLIMFREFLGSGSFCSSATRRLCLTESNALLKSKKLAKYLLFVSFLAWYMLAASLRIFIYVPDLSLKPIC